MMFTKLTKVALPLSIAGTSYYSEKMKVYNFEYPPTKYIIRGEYENKIRRHSPPEKIFEVFATQRDQDEILYMNHNDLFRAVCPFNYTTKDFDEDEEKGYKSTTLLNFADVDGDGLISLYEYFLVVCLIQADREEIKAWFRQTNNLENEMITPELLRKFYNYIRENSRIKLTITKMPDPRKVTLSKDQYDRTLDQLIDGIFKKRNYKNLPMKEFLAMREDLLKDVLRYEFDSFPKNSKGNISGEDFAKSLIVYLDINQVKKYLRAFEQYHFRGEISFTDYYVFQKFLQDNMQALNKTIEEKGVITRKRLRKLIENYQQKLKLQSNPDQIDIFIKVLDLDNSGKIEPEEFQGIVTNRAFYGSGDDNALVIPFLGLKNQFIKWVNKGERILSIVME